MAALAWFLLVAAALTAWYVVVTPLRADILDNDLTLVYIGVRIALEHGWAHIYSLPLQHELFTQLRPHADFNDGERFVSPPPYAWMVLPLTAFGASAAIYAWLVVSALSLVVAWSFAAPGVGPRRLLWLLAALAWYPVMYGLSLAQPDLVIVLIIVAAWRLSESGRPYVAGCVLGLSVIKPQLALLLPLVLLCAGRWRIAAAWAAVAAILAALSVAVVGTAGIGDYLALLREAQGVANNRYFTFAYVLGPGTLSYVAQAAVVAAAAAFAWRNRAAGDARIFALGLVATTLGATYWHLQDFTMLLPAVWLFLRGPLPQWQRVVLLVMAIAAEFAWPLTPLPVLAALVVWFVCFVAPRPRAVEAAA